MRIRAIVLVCVIGLTTIAGIVEAQTTRTIDLQQKWTPEQKQQFWFTPQGSLLLPYKWFLYLKQASSEELFKDDKNILRLGYIPSEKSQLNPDALPIGFSQDSDHGKPFVGFTCAACHTSVLRIDHTPVTVEGAPALSNFWQFLTDLVAALDDTWTTPAKFKSFADDVLGASHTDQQERDLKQELEERKKDLRFRWLSMPPATPYGPARLDAFGGLYNQVVAYDLRESGNARTADAPVSYPFLWDTPQHDKVQWNGTADNNMLGGLGSVFRNIGEALGVFGMVTIEKQSVPPPKYQSSVNVDNLIKLEKLVRRLRSPMWPENVLRIDQAKKRTGAIVYNMYCSNCHAILKDPADPNRKIKAQLIDVKTVGTDPRFAVNYAERFTDPDGATTGLLEGAPKLFLLYPKFDKRASGGDIFSNAILGAFDGRNLGQLTEQTTLGQDEATVRSAIQQYSRAVQKPKIVAEYKARPLNGIWATAPYLHNGSVPNIAELLKPAADRLKTFWIGSHDLDAVNLGLVVTKTTDNDFPFHTSQPGNSNQGHEYGTTLSEDHKKALIEFLKTL